MTATAFTNRRERAHRASDGIEVTLFRSKPSPRATIAVLDTVAPRLSSGLPMHRLAASPQPAHRVQSLRAPNRR
jgi:hypothetical protein